MLNLYSTTELPCQLLGTAMKQKHSVDGIYSFDKYLLRATVCQLLAPPSLLLPL